MEPTMNQLLISPDLTTKSSIKSRSFMNEREFQLEQVKTERARRSFKAFVMQAWPVLEPSTEFVEGIHIDAICSHLQALTEGRISHLIINVPPGHAKSLLTAVSGRHGYGLTTLNRGGCSAAIGATRHAGQREVPAFDRVGLVSTALGRPISIEGRSEPEAS